ncbi:MAG: hypothetical protein JXK94_14870 [Deltaproteobacteria bacterium]|nr:hypothetical protein [Deltaproteobacteria bacterium]
MLIDDGNGKVLELVLGSHVFVRQGEDCEICRDWFDIDSRTQKKLEKIHLNLEKCLGEAVGNYIRA